MRALDWQILILVSLSRLFSSSLQSLCQIWPHNWNIVCETSYRLEEFAKQDEYAVDFDDKAYQRPTKEDEQDTGDESSGALDLLATGKEEECSLNSEE